MSKSFLEVEVIELIKIMKRREEISRKAGEIWPTDSRVAGFYAGVAGGIATVVDELLMILEGVE